LLETGCEKKDPVVSEANNRIIIALQGTLTGDHEEPPQAATSNPPIYSACLLKACLKPDAKKKSSCERSEQQDYHCFARNPHRDHEEPPQAATSNPPTYSACLLKACLKPDAKKKSSCERSEQQDYHCFARNPHRGSRGAAAGGDE
jgi:hypothetical protein